jgi:hypothetical protein
MLTMDYIEDIPDVLSDQDLADLETLEEWETDNA